MSAELQSGDRIANRWRLIAQLGEGAAGIVWRAINESTSRSFALKVMRREATRDPITVQRFMQEARAAGSLRHPGIVEVYDVGFVDKTRPFLVMELLEGESLADRLARTGTLSPRETARLLAPVARALHHANCAGIIHRDLKPENVFLASDHGVIVPKILDFGVSKLVDPSLDPVVTTTGALLGSPGYMSPEQARGDRDVDARSDVWALGVLLYRCLSGVLPFDARTHTSLIDAIEAAAPPDLEAPRRVVRLVRRCLSRERGDRPSALEVAEELEAIVTPDRRLLVLVAATAVAASVLLIALVPRKRLGSPTQPPPIPEAVATSAVVAQPSAASATPAPLISSSASIPGPPSKKSNKHPNRPREPGF